MITPTDVGHGVLGTSAATIVGANSSATQRIGHAIFANTHTVAVTVTVYYMRFSETTASDGVFVAKKTIAPDKTWICTELTNKVLRKSGFIQALADVASVVDYNISADVII